MSIPVITPYQMPAEHDLPANRASWKVDPSRCALLIHDMQRYFVDFFPSGRPPVTDLVANARKLRTAARAAGMPVFYTAQPGRMTREQRGLLHDIWGPGMEGTAAQREIVADLAPAADDTVLTKWRYSAFARSNLAQLLTAAGRDQLVVCGVYAHVGIMMTVCDAFTRDIEVFLAGDACADFTAEDHGQALAYVASRCGMVLSTRTLARAMETVAVRRRP
jgi:isochorismate hydrolase